MKRLEECNEAWEAFSNLPGEHLGWHQAARWVSEIVTRDGRLIATVEGLSLFPPWPFIPRPPRRVKIDQDTYRVKGRLMNVYVTTPDGLTILSFKGTKNFDLRARAVEWAIAAIPGAGDIEVECGDVRNGRRGSPGLSYQEGPEHQARARPQKGGRDPRRTKQTDNA